MAIDLTSLHTEIQTLRLSVNESSVSPETVGFIFNCAVVVSNRVAANTALIVKRGALGIELKRGVNVESDRDILAKTTIYSVDEHYVAYLRDASKVIRIANA